MKKKVKNLEVVVTDSIVTTTPTVAVSTSGYGVEEKEFHYPEKMISEQVVTSLAYQLGTTFKPKIRKQIIECIEVAKSRISEFEVGIKSGGIYLKIKREPKKTIKLLKEVGDRD
jgi:hypothetical protein